MRGKLIGAFVALIGAAWVYSTFFQGTDMRAMLPEWAGGPGPVPPVEEAAKVYTDAFDYNGSSGGDYRAQVAPVTSADYANSPGGRRVEDAARWLDENEETWVQEVDLVSFTEEPQADRQDDSMVVGVGRFTVESRLIGVGHETSVTENDIRFRREGEGWVADWAGDVRVIEEDVREAGQEPRREEAETTSSGTAEGRGTTTAAETPTAVESTVGQQRDEAGSVEEAVRSFNDAYDFEGGSAAAYRAEIEPYVTEDFWSSPRGAQNLASMEEIEAAGDTFVQDAELLDWEPITVGVEEASGYATRGFESSVGEEAGSYTLRHELRLEKEAGVWKVAWAGDGVEGQEGP